MVEYTVKDGIIVDPGKYEGGPAWVPQMHQRLLQGDSDLYIIDDNVVIDFLILTDHERDEYDFGQNIYAVAIWTLEQGFIEGTLLTENEYNGYVSDRYNA